MMNLIDSHAHIFLEHFDDDLDAVVDEAQRSGVKKILLPNIDSTTIDSMLRVERLYPDLCHSMIGLHPCSVKENYEEELRIVEEWLEKRSFVAIGEIGTDLYWDKTYWPEQQKAFNAQCELALQYKLPVVIHCRESIDETIELVMPFAKQGLKGVFHCFTGTVEQGDQIRSLGFCLGIGGVATFKNGGMDKVLPKLGIDQLILETDSPYLTPSPYRGKRNVPGYTSLVCERVAELLDMQPDLVAEATTKNCQDLFRIDGL
ncbi:MAG: TatD family hydrolase [Cyclobacteriaceae bacterium]